VIAQRKAVNVSHLVEVIDVILEKVAVSHELDPHDGRPFFAAAAEPENRDAVPAELEVAVLVFGRFGRPPAEELGWQPHLFGLGTAEKAERADRDRTRAGDGESREQKNPLG
jgi:hypothetical protein